MTIRVHAQVNPAAALAAEFAEARVREALSQEGPEVALSWGSTEDALEAALPEAEALLLTGQAPLHDVARRAPRLRWISWTSAGVEWPLALDLPPSVALTNASGSHEPKAAEFALMAVLMLNMRIPALVTAQHAHRWAPLGRGLLAGRTALVLGTGAVGRAAARALKGQGMRVLGNSRSGAPHPAFDAMTAAAGFRAQLPEAEFLVIALPLTAETQGIVGAAELDLLPQGAGVVNIGRGEQLDADALAARLRGGRLSGAVLDALPQEPLPESSPLWEVPNLVVTQHCGLYDPMGYGGRCLELFAANLRRFAAGEGLHQLVERGRGY